LSKEPKTWTRKLKTSSTKRAPRGKHWTFNVCLSKHDVWVLSFMLHLQLECLPWTSMIRCIRCIYLFKCLAHDSNISNALLLVKCLTIFSHHGTKDHPHLQLNPHSLTFPHQSFLLHFFIPKKQKPKYIILSTINHYKKISY